ncbi:aminoacyl-tRNA hydrolase [Roseococcus pinisoli]|uniref:Peptidyl-tRNA hydrolase n=1 Tax=Roseococcus pinisoli TaxID=2835040 RepID=A0ABS5QFW9_9PROT|nr:aminoacyl-tRNA hydrolase [uncultured Roseococcus sp.]MBS7812581.1 aminoacyl-tRNA hydrolase [Roseococcus pinisoli]
MLLWVGLGNPGPEYAKQRHNIGFMALDAIARRHGFSPWRSKYKGEVAEGSLGTQKILLLKPMTYMNASGNAVQAAAGFHKIPPADIWAWHDELDLAPGKVRIKKGGGAAGHNGLRDMQRALATPDYWRIRLGIGHPGHKDRVTGHVLGNFAKVETWVEPLLDALADAAPLLAQGKPEDFMTRVALLTQEKN